MALAGMIILETAGYDTSSVYCISLGIQWVTIDTGSHNNSDYILVI